MAPSSSYSSSSATSTQTAAASSSSTVQNSNGFASQGVHYFFGFLITFIVLLSLFVCCGFSSRRRLAQRRGLWATWDSDPGIIEQHSEGSTPTFFETPFVKGDDPSLWFSIQPLSARQVTGAPSSLASSHITPVLPSPPPIRLASQNPHAMNGLSLPVWMPVSSVSSNARNDHNEKAQGKDDLRTTPTVMQVAVVIAMPRCPRTSALQEEGPETRPRHLEIGLACEPWNTPTRISEAS